MSKKEQEHDTLGNRLKQYEALSTSRRLMPNTPVYARIDGRAFHTFCRGLEKPFSKAFIEVMQETCKYLVEETNACLGYVQSDEISLGWESIVKAPFDGRVQKLESNLASLASAKFVQYLVSITPLAREPFESDFKTKEEYRKSLDEFVKMDVDWTRMRVRTDECPPSFDCRVFNVPTMTELANCFLWRENDAIKNSISGMALNFYSHKELQNKNSDEKIHMMRMKGHCFYEDTDPAFMRGTFYHRENYLKELTDEEVARIPEKQREQLISIGKNTSEIEFSILAKTPLKPDRFYCMRSHIVPMNLPYRLTETQDLVNVLLEGWGYGKVYCKISNPTFDLSKREEV